MATDSKFVGPAHLICFEIVGLCYSNAKSCKADERQQGLVSKRFESTQDWHP
jgi:hypothetical protein